VDRISPSVADPSKYYAVFKKELKNPIRVTSSLPQLWTKYSHTVPGVNGFFEAIQFSLAFGKKDKKTEFYGVSSPGDIWRPDIFSSISLDSIDCIYVKISGGFKETAVQIDYITFVEYPGGPTISVIEDFEDSTVTDVEMESVVPTSYSLSQNYPNPFNPSTTISYVIPLNDNFVSLKVFDLLGREIETLVSEEKSVGEHSVRFDGSHLSSGMYLYQINIGHGQFVQTKKMILVK